MAPTTRTPPTSARSNAEWLAELRAGSRESRAAFEDLRALLRRVLTRVLSHRRFDSEAIADLVQEGLIRIVDRLDDFRGDSRFTTLACAVAVRTALTTLRRAHWRDVSLDTSDLETAHVEWPHDPISDPERAARADEIASVMQRLIADELTAKQRQVILGELAGMPQEMLLERLDVGRNALYKLAHDARRKLKRALEGAGVSVQDVSDLLAQSSE
jgi:RNA polymerase sigma-70 factor (ECF subfamily)